MNGLERVGWLVAALVLVTFAIPWFLWGDDAVIAGLPIWLWWHVGWMLLASIAFWLFARRAWGIGIEPGFDERGGPRDPITGGAKGPVADGRRATGTDDQGTTGPDNRRADETGGRNARGADSSAVSDTDDPGADRSTNGRDDRPVDGGDRE